MKINLARTAGFCFGVERAVSTAIQQVQTDASIVTLGPIIHNRHVTKALEEKGIQTVDTLNEVCDGQIVIIRSHGVGRDVYEKLEERHLPYIDATCPFVERIHEIARRTEETAGILVIMGNRTHPEVIGISGWCSRTLCFSDAKELISYFAKNPNMKETRFSVVAQTTFHHADWETALNFLKKECTNCKIFDTICDATEKRQKEAAILANKSEAMIVVGDAASSNTNRLYELCKQNCSNVCLIDNAAELDLQRFQGVQSVGITAGASTPSWIIKEVIHTMNEEILDQVAEQAAAQTTEESFDELLEQSLITLSTGDKVKGIVTGFTPTEVTVDLGAKQAGYIPNDQVSSDPNEKPEDVLKIGDEVEVFVVRVNDVEGYVTLSKKRLDANKGWEEVEALKESGEAIDVKINDVNAGGVVANYKGVRIFVPASQSGVAKGGDLNVLLNTTVKLRITEVNRSRRRVVGSIRAVASEARKAAEEKVWAEIEVGKQYHGFVKSLTAYGAFVDIGGVDGMVHVSKLSWNRIKTPADAVSVGQEVDVKVIALDPEKRRISLTLRDEDKNPWTVFTTNYKVGDTAEVKVVKLMDFGAFAEIVEGVDGLIHISQIADRRIGKPSDVLTEGETVTAKITDIDMERKRISLSIRALLAPTVEEQEEVVETETAEAATVYSSENPVEGQDKIAE